MKILYTSTYFDVIQKLPIYENLDRFGIEAQVHVSKIWMDGPWRNTTNRTGFTRGQQY